MSLLTYVQNGLTAVSKEIAETKYPEIVFPQFVFVDTTVQMNTVL